MINGRTRVFALLGDPVAHSLSPAMYNAAFEALGIDAVYVALRSVPAQVPPLMTSLCLAGGGGNLTVPFKRLGAVTARPAEPGPWPVCNTFWAGDDGVVMGASTDPDGIRVGWEHLGRPKGAWLLLGTGGSAMAAACAARDVEAPVAVRSRSADRRAAFEAECASLGIPLAGDDRPGMVVNCTPLGLRPEDGLPISLADLPPGAAVLDLVYRRGETALVLAARASARRAVDGRVVLLGQGIAAFRRWFPRIVPPAEVMGAAVRRALA